MRMMRWDPIAELSRLDSDLGRFLFAEPSRALRRFEPAIDVLDEEDAFVLLADVPGMKAEELSIQFEDGVLMLSGERKLEAAPENGAPRKAHHAERLHGTFRRAFTLPKTADGERVEASLKDGVLTIRVPKKTSPEKRRIEVKSHS